MKTLQPREKYCEECACTLEEGRARSTVYWHDCSYQRTKDALRLITIARIKRRKNK